jgi:peptidoglycan/xylan/chitin deacetylase (PgdA/CDA1 family)
MSTTTTDLDAEIDALCEADARATARIERIPDLRWPDGARIAVNFTLDFDAMLLRRLLDEPPQQLTKGEFGGRVGIWRLVELFDRCGVTGTIFTVGRICELYPQALRAAAASGHEIADHMWEHHVPKDPALERDHLLKTAAALEATTGKRPVGTRSAHSHALLREQGFLYASHDTADHRPYWLADREGRHPLLNLPFHYAIDDAMFYSFAWLGSPNGAQRITDPERVMEMWWEAFLQQWRDGEGGGYLNVCMHPFVSGRALRVAMLERLIRRMQEKPGVWFPSCEQVARHVLARHPPKRLAWG